LLFADFGTKWKPVFLKLEPILIRNIANSPSFTIKSAHLETLCWSWYLFSEEIEIKQHLSYLMDFLSEKEFSISKESASFYQTCLDMWCLLVTLIDPNIVIDEYLISLEYIVNILSSDHDLTVRLAAGETLALIASLVYDIETENEEEYTIFYFNGYFDIQEVVEVLQTTKEVQNRKISKKDREKQRHTFKDVLKTLETGVSPSEELIVSGNKFTFSHWADLKRINALRSILGSGFLLHLQYNPLISNQLGIKIVPIDKTKSKTEKQIRMNYSTAEDKERTKQRNIGRNNKLKRTAGEQSSDLT